jgi:hypothetical protein
MNEEAIENRLVDNIYGEDGQTEPLAVKQESSKSQEDDKDCGWETMSEGDDNL